MIQIFKITKHSRTILDFLVCSKFSEPEHFNFLMYIENFVKIFMFFFYDKSWGYAISKSTSVLNSLTVCLSKSISMPTLHGL